ncbi:hypothetical protein [Ornithinibacillus sp. JPR2-1]|uniref:hypothetical protein n=1 Tax=Ornithinibacillus sp. JPR2-1 TaxID=2094019 RepID=UPI0031DE970E
MFVSNKVTYNSQPAFVSSDKIVSRTRTATQDMGVEDDKGRKIVKAGTVYPANDGTAEGIVLHDVDVTFNNQPVGVMVEGYVYESRLPETVSDAAKKALKLIVFEEYNVTEEDE